ncbi:hypothetical protein VTK73DRAFT_286 [Phialemonium thermophilum]|uniref:NB-ARC domain-containing protein n=1 Tax=Phialemonium thermophilum TaxID=223376 RepID=A0ABR3VVY4_9PEZI
MARRVSSDKTLVLVPYQKNDGFVGRKAILETLERRLVRPVTKARLSLFGLGGVGKTQVALQFAYWIQENCADISVFWVHVSSAERFRESYASIALACRIAGHDDPKADVLQLVKRWLEAGDRGWWLMVLDSADDAQLFDQTGGLRQYIPECAHGSVLITTRNKQAGLRLAQGKPPLEGVGCVVLCPFSLHRANAAGGDGPSDESQQALCSRLEHLPLVIIQAAAFMQENTVTAAEYLALLDRNDQTLVDLLSEDFDSVGGDSGTPRAVAETWIVSFEQIKQQDALAGDLLSLMSFFDRQAIALEFVVSYCDRHGYDRGIRLTKALGLLKAFSFVTAAKDDTLDMHRLVQLATRNWLTKRIWDWKTSEKLLFQAIELRQEVLGKEDLDTLESVSGLASTYSYQGRWQEAEELGVQVMNIRKRVLGLEHPKTLTSMGNLASTYEAQGLSKEAEVLGVQVMDIRKRVLGLEHPDTLFIMGNVAATYRAQGRWKEAEGLLLQVLDMGSKGLEPGHPDTLATIVNLALTYQAQGRWDEAEELNVQGMDMSSGTLGPEHPSTLTIMNNLALTWKRQGRSDEALSLMRRCVQLRQRILGPNHPRTRSSASTLERWEQASIDHSTADEESARSDEKQPG